MYCSHDMDPHDNNNIDSRENDSMDSRDNMDDSPTAWNVNDKSDSLSLSSDGFEVKYTSENN
jgi:hypothetical protein